MTARHDERDPLPEEEHRPVSSKWARKQAIEATRAAVAAVKERRKKPLEVRVKAADSSRWCGTCDSYGDHHTDRHSA